MRILVEGSGGSAGWPEPGCRCASCLRQAAAGNARSQSTVVVDGRLLDEHHFGLLRADFRRKRTR